MKHRWKCTVNKMFHKNDPLCCMMARTRFTFNQHGNTLTSLSEFWRRLLSVWTQMKREGESVPLKKKHIDKQSRRKCSLEHAKNAPMCSSNDQVAIKKNPCDHQYTNVHEWITSQVEIVNDVSGVFVTFTQYNWLDVTCACASLYKYKNVHLEQDVRVRWDINLCHCVCCITWWLNWKKMKKWTNQFVNFVCFFVSFIHEEKTNE